MKKIILTIVAVSMAIVSLCAQQLQENTYSCIKVHYQTPMVTESNIMFDGVAYSILNIEGAIGGGAIGTPTLPQLSSLIEVPVCKGFSVKVDNAVYDTLHITLPVLPMQPSRSKSDTTAHALVIDNATYQTDAFVGDDLASVEYLGVARDRHIARLIFSPLKVNPVQGTILVCRSADICVEYLAADAEATDALYSRYHTPAYSVGTTLNNLPTPKYVSDATPIRMAVVTHSSLRCKKLDEFLRWKRQQGLRVDVFYIDEMGILSTAAIANTLTNLYTNASDADPAPTYLLVIGDIDQVPTNASRITSSSYAYNDHITDLYYTTWSSGDKLPDCYHGRMSATDTTMLTDILNKTIIYEQYLMPDDRFLGRAALIAGVDYGYSSDNAYTYADPAMDYIAAIYINHTNGYDTVVYYKNRTTFQPNGVHVTGSCQSSSTANALRQFYNQGVGWINYSAHGDWDEWHEPSFTVRNANAMTNSWKPAFMIGNCCLSNRFNSDVCLGEALLRKGNNAGAIGYIGGTNYTYWGEDFYWAVGMRSNISGTMSPTYNASNRGSYDYLFHTHSEPLTQTAATAAKMMFYGNMAVQNSGSQLAAYYWEIYHLMGDPTLMPWLGRAEDTYVDLNDAGAAIYVGTNSGAYIAVVDPDDDMRVISATFADINGNASLSLPSNHASLMLSITSQGHKPWHHRFNSLGIDEALDASAEVYPNPANSNCNVRCSGMRQLTLVNSLGQTVRTITPASDNATLDLQGLDAGIYIIRIATDRGTSTRKLMVL